MTAAVPRAKVKKEQTWNAESVFPSAKDFHDEVKSILDSLPAIKAYQGHLGDGPDTFIQAMKALETLARPHPALPKYFVFGEGKAMP